MTCCLTARSISCTSVNSQLMAYYVIHIRATSQEVPMILIHNMCTEITLTKLLPYFPVANELYGWKHFRSYHNMVCENVYNVTAWWKTTTFSDSFTSLCQPHFGIKVKIVALKLWIILTHPLIVFAVENLSLIWHSIHGIWFGQNFNIMQSFLPRWIYYQHLFYCKWNATCVSLLSLSSLLVSSLSPSLIPLYNCPSVKGTTLKYMGKFMTCRYKAKILYSSEKNLQLSPVIMWSSITRYCTHCCRDWG